MILLINKKLNKGIIVPHKCGSTSFDYLANNSDDWTIIDQPIRIWNQWGWENLEWYGVIRNPVNWFISGYVYSQSTYLGNRKSPFDLHLKHIIYTRDYVKFHAKLPPKVTEYWFDHCVATPDKQIKSTGLNIKSYLKLEDENFNDIILDLFGSGLPEQNKGSTDYLPRISNETVELLRQLDYGKGFGYDLDTYIEKYNKKLKEINTL